MIEKYDFSQFMCHAHAMSEANGKRPACKDQNHMLRFWERAKSQYLYDLLGHQLVVSKPISFDKGTEQLSLDMYHMLNDHRTFESKLFELLNDCLHPIYGGWGRPDNGDAQFINEVQSMFNERHLIEGRISQNCSATVMGHQIILTQGQKSMRALGRIAGLLGMTDEFERFRIAHSQVLNQKRIFGTLNLSIHPLDYATASDNEAGWSSCMSWKESGCYRLGTVEMMNSPMVICAYLSSDHPMHDVGGDVWNSKKWRAWIIVDKRVVMVNKQYPYHNDNIAMSALNWVLELAKDNLGWHYLPPEVDFDYTRHGFTFETNFMYNDVCEGHCGALGLDAYGDDINFSGVAQCMWCGDEIEFTSGDDAGTLCCPACMDTAECVCCENTLYHDDSQYFGPDGDGPYCWDCYSDRYQECDKCNSTVEVDSLITIAYDMNPDLMAKLVNQEGEKSAIHKEIKRFGWVGNRAIQSYDVYHHNALRICTHCLNEVGLNRSDLIYDVTKYGDWQSHWFQAEAVLDPTKVTYEQFYELCKPYRKYEDTDGSFERVWRTLYNDFRVTMIEKGYTDI